MVDQQQQMLNSLSSFVVYKCQSHLEMSRFLCSGSWLFFFPVRAFCFYRKIFAPGCSRNDDSCHPRPTASPVFVGLVRSAALRSPKGEAVRAQRRTWPTTGAILWPPTWRLASAPRGGPLDATDGLPAASTSVS